MKTQEVKDTRKCKKRAHNNDDDQASYQEKILALQNEAARKSSGTRGTKDAIFSKIS